MSCTDKRNGMKLIVDVVLNHTCGCPFCTNEGVITTLRWGTHRIIAHWKGYNNSERFNMLDWGPKQRENEQAHAIFLQELIDMGVDGFRFDAAKHITPAHFSKLRELVKNVNFDEFVWYGEVMDGNVEVCNEYVSIGMKVVDFPLVYNLMGALSLGKDIREAMKPSVWGYCAISVADCHDSVLGDSYHFSDAQDSILAISFILARNEGMPLVYHSKLADQP